MVKRYAFFKTIEKAELSKYTSFGNDWSFENFSDMDIRWLCDNARQWWHVPFCHRERANLTVKINNLLLRILFTVCKALSNNTVM